MKSWPSFILSKLVWLEESIIAYTLASMTGIAFANVIVRRIFNGSLTWALELTLYLFLYLILFGMSYTLRKGIHVGVDVIVNLLPKMARKWVNLIAAILTFLYAVAFVVTGWAVASKFFLRFSKIGSDELDIPHWITYGFLTAGFAYFALTTLFAIIEILQNKRETITASHEADEMVHEITKDLK